MMNLTADIAQPIVDRATAIIRRNINRMDASGIIVASGDPTRIGTYHGSLPEPQHVPHPGCG